MPVYLFTYHSYRSWGPDHRRGYVQRGTGYLPRDLAKARKYDTNAKQPPVIFNEKIQHILIRIAVEICAGEEWTLHAAACETTHIHLLVSWRKYTPWLDVSTRLKNLLSYRLGREFSVRGKKWFVRGTSRKRVKDRQHFDHLVTRYLPKHRGLFWRADISLPQVAAGTN